MSREIKFRGLSHKRGWFYGDRVNTSTTDGQFVAIKETPYNVNNGKFNLIPMEIIQGTEGQYTGLKDENGQEIFEGDIVICENEYADIVVWNEEYCRFDTEQGDGFDSYQEFKIIGNIHTTPELVEGNMKEKCEKCENCGKHPAEYTCDSLREDTTGQRICCVCADQMITLIPDVKEALNIKIIKEDA